MEHDAGILERMSQEFPKALFHRQPTQDGIPTVWIQQGDPSAILRYLKTKGTYRTLYDLTAVDERLRQNREGLPKSDFTVVTHLMSYERNSDIRLKIPLIGEYPSVPTLTD